MTNIYFDNSATTQACPEAILAATEVMSREFGNPSSSHALGAVAFRSLNKAREICAKIISANPEEIYFTGSGTESNNTAILGAAQAFGKSRRKLLILSTEHPSVIEPAKHLAGREYDLCFIPTDKQGLLNLSTLSELLDDDVFLLSVAHVNNETGAIQPLREIGAMLRKHAPEVFFHVDGVQSFARLPVELKAWQADAFSASGHKIHASKGVGFLWLKKSRHLPPLLYGGGQERRFRSGTENMPGIMAFAAAAELAAVDMNAHAQHMEQIKTFLRDSLRENIADCQVNGPEEQVAHHILNMSFLGVRSEVLLHCLEEQGIFVSAGSACTSRSSKGSHVLSVMGLSEAVVDSAIRFSLCRYNTVSEAKEALPIIISTVNEMRSLTGYNSKRG